MARFYLIIIFFKTDQQRQCSLRIEWEKRQLLGWDRLAVGLRGMFHDVASMRDGFPGQIFKRTILGFNSLNYRERRLTDPESPF